MHPKVSFTSIPELNAFLQKQNGEGKFFSPFLALEQQRGETCKIVGVANLLKYFYQAGVTTAKPLPAYKHKDLYRARDKSPDAQCSTREIAKLYADSKVGEIYNADQLEKLVHALGFVTQDNALEQAEVTLEHYDLTNSETDLLRYIARIKALIDTQLTPPLIFFDVDDEGFPSTDGDGLRQHCAMVLGYLEAATGELSFLVGHWGQYYLFDAHELALSAYHLPSSCASEAFYKHKTIYVNNFQECKWSKFEEKDTKEEFYSRFKKLPELREINLFEKLKNLEEDNTLLIDNFNYPRIRELQLSTRQGYAEKKNTQGFRLALCVVKPRLNNENKNTSPTLSSYKQTLFSPVTTLSELKSDASQSEIKPKTLTRN